MTVITKNFFEALLNEGGLTLAIQEDTIRLGNCRGLVFNKDTMEKAPITFPVALGIEKAKRITLTYLGSSEQFTFCGATTLPNDLKERFKSWLVRAEKSNYEWERRLKIEDLFKSVQTMEVDGRQLFKWAELKIVSNSNFAIRADKVTFKIDLDNLLSDAPLEAVGMGSWDGLPYGTNDITTMDIEKYMAEARAYVEKRQASALQTRESIIKYLLPAFREALQEAFKK